MVVGEGSCGPGEGITLQGGIAGSAVTITLINLLYYFTTFISN